MKFVRGLLVAALAAAVLLAVLALALLTLDLGALGQPMAAWASTQFGRPLVIDGPVSIRLGRSLRIAASGIRLANTPWGSRRDMLAVGRLTVEIDTASLLRRPVIVTGVEVDGLDLMLERRADGSNNWEFAPDDADDSRWPEALPVVVDRVVLRDARIGFAGPRLERPLRLRLSALEQRRGGDGMLALAGRGSANDEPIVLDARVGTFAGLVAGRDFAAVVAARIGELAVDLDLRVDDVARPVDTRLVLKVQGPGAEYLATRFGIRNLGAGPLAVDAVVRPAAADGGVEGEIAGQVGQFAFRAKGALADPLAMRRLRAEVDLEGPDLSLAGGLAGIDRLPVVPFQLTGVVERAGEMVRIDDATLVLPDGRAQLAGTITRFTSLAGSDLRFEWTGAELGRFRELLGLPAPFTGEFAVAGGLVTSGDRQLLDMRATTRLGALEAKGALGPRPDFFGTRLDLDASGPSLAPLGRLAGVEGLPDGAFTASGNVEWTAAGAVVRGGELISRRARLRLDGRIARDPLGPGTDLNWQASGPDVRAAAAPLGVDGLPAAAFDLRGRLRREAGVSRLDGVQGTIAGAALRVAGRIADAPRRGTTLDFSVAGPRLEAFAGLAPDYELPAGPFSIDGGIALAPARVILRGLSVAAAGAQGVVDADIELPLSAVRGTFTVAASGPDVARFLPRSGTGPRPVLPFRLRARGRASGGTWRLDTAELDTTVARLNASGTLDWAPDFSATALTVGVAVPDLAAVGSLLGTTLPAQPLELSAEFTGTPTAFTAKRAQGRVGATDFDGSLSLALGKRPVVDADFRSDLLDLTPFFDTVADPVPAVAARPGKPAPRRRRDDARLIPDTPLPLAWLDIVDGSLAVRATSARVLGIALEGLDLKARLDGGQLSLDSLSLKAPPDGYLTATGLFRPGTRGISAKVSATGQRVALALLGETPAQRNARPRADIALEMAAEGGTWRELAGSLSGRLQLTSGAGLVPAASMNMLFGDLWRDIAAATMPGVAVRETTEVRCLAAFVTATDGVVQTAPALVMQTPKVNVIAHGAVDLGREQVGFYLSTAPRRGRIDVSLAEIVNPYIKLTGTLADPRLGVDPKGVLFSGGAAVATAGISILAKGVWDRMFRAEDPCAAAATEAARLAEGPRPSPRRLLPRWRGSP